VEVGVPVGVGVPAPGVHVVHVVHVVRRPARGGGGTSGSWGGVQKKDP
jgi:hypothetical protein